MAGCGGNGTEPCGSRAGLVVDDGGGADVASALGSTLRPVQAAGSISSAADAPLPLVEAAPRWRLSRRVFGGFVAMGDAVVLAAVTLLLWKVARVPLVPGVAVVAGFLTLAWLDEHYGPHGTVVPFAATLATWLMTVAAAGGVFLLLDAALGIDAAGWSGLAIWAIGAGVAVLAWRWWMGRRAVAWRRQGHLLLRLAVLAGADWLHSGLGALRGACARDGEARGVVLAGLHEHGDSAIPPGRERWPHLWAEVAAGRVDGVVVALPWSAPDEVAQACRALRGLAVDVWLLPPPDETAALLQGEEVLPGVTLLAVDRRPLADWRGVAKRAEDILLGVSLLVLFAPTLAVVALVVALDSRGPILLRQRRFGYGNAPFEVYKFRTMHHDRGDASGAAATLPGDSRVTRSGRFLRASSLDELPQLFNVLKGEMSLVGPRPHPVGMHIEGRLYHLVAPDYAARHRMKPGITGLAQISGFRGLVDTPEKAHGRLECDLRYIRQWSIAMDLRILWRTVFKGFFGSGAF
jgi:exopolysaccharide biosynthesis polyprenyl glycosylphosphotransferase